MDFATSMIRMRKTSRGFMASTLVFLAGWNTPVIAGDAAPEPSEELAIRWATLDEILADIDAGAIHDLLTVAAIARYALLRAAEPARGRADHTGGGPTRA